jgi:hypothetical protein
MEPSQDHHTDENRPHMQNSTFQGKEPLVLFVLDDASLLMTTPALRPDRQDLQALP